MGPQESTAQHSSPPQHVSGLLQTHQEAPDHALQLALQLALQGQHPQQRAAGSAGWYWAPTYQWYPAHTQGSRAAWHIGGSSAQGRASWLC